MINIFTPKGLLDCTPIFGNRPVLLDRHAQLLITALADAGVAACILHLLARRPALLRSAASQGMAQTPSSRQLAVLLGPFTLAYLASLCVNGAFHNIFDRYALVLVFLATLILLRVIQDTVPSRIALVGFAPLILIAIYELQAAHIPSNVIDGGFEFNAWTQIERTGRVNDAHLMSPADNAKIDAFYSTPHPCSPFNVYLFPDLHARYSLSYGPRTCGEATAFAPVVYRRWLGRQSVPIYIVSHPPSIMP
jgi:hypothetical protein